MQSIEPERGIWYQPAGVNDWFRVLRVEGGQVTVEYFDGYEDVIGVQSWYELKPKAVAAVPTFVR
jgi:hypothetical protein